MAEHYPFDNGGRQGSQPMIPKKGAWDDPSGWSVRHCGHPTALWPYSIIRPDGYQVLAHNGRGFTTVAAARGVVRGILWGWLRVSEGRVNATSDGSPMKLQKGLEHD